VAPTPTRTAKENHTTARNTRLLIDGLLAANWWFSKPE
jgi:hypothetical protein